MKGIKALAEGERTEDLELLEEFLDLHEEIENATELKQLEKFKKDIESKKKEIFGKLANLFKSEDQDHIAPLLVRLKYLGTTEALISKNEERIGS